MTNQTRRTDGTFSGGSRRGAVLDATYHDAPTH